jgi:1,6-anhydro-N-acetylmuramate kinase
VPLPAPGPPKTKRTRGRGARATLSLGLAAATADAESHAECGDQLPSATLSLLRARIVQRLRAERGDQQSLVACGGGQRLA